MPNEDNKIIKYNQGEKSVRSPFIIYADLECLIEKIRTCYNNLEESSTTEINKHTPSGYSLFTHCSNDMQDVHKNIDDYNPRKKRKVLMVFDDMIADMINNKNLDSIITEFFIRGRKLNIFIVFIKQSYFKVPKDVRLNSTHFFIMKIPNKRELQQIALNHSSGADFKDFMKIYKKCTKEPYSFLVHDTTLPS